VRLIIEPIEEVMGPGSHLQSMPSRASAYGGRVRLEFYPGTDMGLSAVEVRDRLDRVRWRFPEDVTHVSLRRWSSTDISTLPMRVS
jgi:multidrug efflux pump subunit AcrB